MLGGAFEQERMGKKMAGAGGGVRGGEENEFISPQIGVYEYTNSARTMHYRTRHILSASPSEPPKII